MVLIVIVSIAATVSRLVDGFAGISKMLAEYFSGCLTIMSKKLEQLSGFSYTFGSLTLYGYCKYFEKFFSLFLKVLGFEMQTPLFHAAGIQMAQIESAVNIGSGMSNAFVTPFYYFYVDGGLVGVILFSFIWGVFCNQCYTGLRIKFSVKSFYLWAFAMFTICFSMIRAWLATPEMAATLLMCLIFIRKTNQGKKI